jgi:phosphoribosylaminoimidazolecarboxamide formyltransferase/IMP cyclohydrolase
VKIKRALISVSDKAGIVEFAEGLAELGVSIVSSGGTARSLTRAGVLVSTVSDVTGDAEMLDGRVKTLHPRIHGGILADRRNPQHLRQLKERNISPIDLVVCNLYPFSETAARREVSEDDVIEQIDIGGPAMLRAAAKNYRSVGVVVNPARYPEVLEEMRSRSGALSDYTRRRLAAEAFAHTASYDIAIGDWMNGGEHLPKRLFVALERQIGLRYGENPHQPGAFYSESGDPGWRQLAGKDPSYTNILDFDAAWRLVSEFSEPAAAIVKHTNPCGCAVGTDVDDAFRRALECDPRAAFGGVIALNRQVDGTTTAKKVNEILAHIVVAAGFTPEALDALTQRKNLIAIEASPPGESIQLRSAAGGVLVQHSDSGPDPRDEMTVVTMKQPTDEEWEDLLFAWRVTKHVKSNAAVFASDKQAFGVGAGQMSRVEAVELAARRAGDRAKGAVMATDGFFPFRDGVDAAVDAGARALIAPGGGVRDPEVIAAAEEHGIPMVFTGRRHFRH